LNNISKGIFLSRKLANLMLVLKNLQLLINDGNFKTDSLVQEIQENVTILVNKFNTSNFFENILPNCGNSFKFHSFVPQIIQTSCHHANNLLARSNKRNLFYALD